MRIKFLLAYFLALFVLTTTAMNLAFTLAPSKMTQILRDTSGL